MKKFLILIMSIFLLVSISSAAAASYNSSQTEIMGSFRMTPPETVSKQNDDYIPVKEVADIIDVNLDWKLSGTSIEGNLGGYSFKTDAFIISRGDLYLPAEIFAEKFDLYIEVRGTRYIIYKYIDTYSELELTLQTDSRRYARREPMAVSVLLKNNASQEIELKYTSGKQYDLVLIRNNREIWRYSNDLGYISAITRLNIDPDDYKLYTALINPSERGFLYQGNYELYAEITTYEGGIIRSNAVNIEIR